MTPKIKEILSWYGSDNPGSLTNLSRLLNHGKLAGTGKLVILPVDQGFEHGPARSFAANPPAYDPRYHFELAILQGRGYANESGCNAYAAPLGFLEAGAREFAGEIPLILKVNDHDALLDEADPTQALTSSVEVALRLGCVAIGFTIYPGSANRFEMYEQIRAYAAEAKRCGLAVVIWSYARGSGVSTAGETSILWREASPTISLLMPLKLPPSWGHILSKSNYQLTTSNSRRRERFTKKCRFRSQPPQKEFVTSSNLHSMVGES
jgi:fructose-bisphosphate aldolase, class I